MSTTYAWNLYTQAAVDEVWNAIAALFQGLAARPSWRKDVDGLPLLVVREATALGQARELGFTIAADARQPPCEVDWRVREIDGGAVVTLTVLDPEEGWDAEVEQGWLPVLDRLAQLVNQTVRV